ncbi:hypothetical protein evm_012919 [Chilo suppressalis]|nr:hypothetical protein evm_012919 [Chilo suppressalis]
MLCTVEGSREDLTDCGRASGSCNSFQDAAQPGCLSFNCRNCTDAIGKAMREISTLLDSFDSAVELYPSSKAMTVEHPLIATNAFKNRLRAMCVWFNTALHMRLKVLAVRRMMRSLRLKGRRRDPCAAVSR